MPKLEDGKWWHQGMPAGQGTGVNAAEWIPRYQTSQSSDEYEKRTKLKPDGMLVKMLKNAKDVNEPYDPLPR